MTKEFTRPGTRAAAETAAEAIQDARLALIEAAISGDMVLVITGLDESPEPTAAAWSQTATITLENASGDTHSWFNAVVATKASVVDDSTAGTASVDSADVTFVNGVASVVISGDEAAWLDSETVTFTLADITVMGNVLATSDVVITFATPN